MLQDRIHSLPRPVDYVEDAVGEPRLRQELAQPHRAKRCSLRGLEDVGVASPYRYGNRPQGDHAGEVERGYGRHHPQRVAPGRVVYALRHVAYRLAHHEGGHPAGELHDLYAPADFSAVVLSVLAVL